MSKNELKAALTALQVKKPLKLSRQGPQFSAPTSMTSVVSETVVSGETLVAPPTSVTQATQVSSVTQVSAVTNEGDAKPCDFAQADTTVTPLTQVTSETKVTQNTSETTPTLDSTVTQVSAETQVNPVALVDADTMVNSKTQVTQTTPVTGATQVNQVAPVTAEQISSTGTGIERQSSAVTLEAQASPKLMLGYTRLPNVALMRIVGGELSRSEVQVLLLVARFTISFQRRFAPISKSVFERQAKLSGPAVLQALAELQSKGLIEKIPGDQNGPNQFALTHASDCFGRGGTDPAGTSATQVTGGTQVTRATRVSEQTGVTAVTPNKDNNKYNNNKHNLSLNVQCKSQILQTYFDCLRPARKREREFQAYLELRQDYSEGEIEQAWVYLTENGMPANGQPCHSPMAFLLVGMAQVHAEATASCEKAREREERERQAQEARRREEAEATRESREVELRERAFARAFRDPERQWEVIRELTRGMPFSPQSTAARALAVAKWWDSLGRFERAEIAEELGVEV